jgi:hypothetical protein
MLKNIRFIFFTTFLTIAFSQDNPIVYRGVYIKPKAGMIEKLENGFKDHNKKFHTKKGHEVISFQMISGPRYGWYLRVTGGQDWSHFDKIGSNPKDAKHWAKYILPYTEPLPMKDAGPFHAVYLPDLSYNYEITPFNRVRTVTLKHAMGRRFRAFRQKIKEADEKTKSKSRYAIYYIEDGANAGKYVEIYSMDKWEDLNPSSPSWSERMDKAHGSGTTDKLLEEISKIGTNRTSEVRKRRLDLSTNN